ncbi:MAG TPA: HIT family protein [Acidimicrobiales bacterium]|nr:HIT family protein [Acidimicrobiales bacterium]
MLLAALTGDCLFCRIVAGDLPAHVVLDNDIAIAFLDYRPVFPGHCLLVPRAHYETLADLPPDLVGQFFFEVQQLAGAVERAMEAHGTFVALNNKVSQSVAHLHVHVVPRRRKDGLRGFFWPRQKYASDGEAAEIATRIRLEAAN